MDGPTAPSEERPSFSESLAAEASLILSAPESIFYGACDRVQKLCSDPKEFAKVACTGAGMGIGLSLMARSRTFGRLATEWLPYALGLSAVADVGVKIGSPLYGCWKNPSKLEEYQQELGHNGGSMAIDWLAMGLTGYGAARATMKFNGALGRQSLIGKDISGITEAVRNGFERPSQLSSTLFWTDGVNAQLGVVKKGGYSPEYARAGAEFDQAVNTLGKALNNRLTSRGLPETTFDWQPLRAADAQSLHGEGKIEFGAHKLSKSSRRELANLATHELAHIEQENLMLRRLADKLGIGEKANAEQLVALKEQFEAHLTTAPNDAWVEAVLQRRGGKPLAAHETARADNLLSSEKFYNENLQKQAKLLEHNNNVFKAQEEVRRAGWQTAKEILSSPDRAQYYLGDQPMTPQLTQALEALANQSIYAPASPRLGNERRILLDALGQQLNATAAGAKQTHIGYLDSLCEREAYTLGNRAGWHYLMTGRGSGMFMAAGFGAGSDSVWLGIDSTISSINRAKQK